MEIEAHQVPDLLSLDVDDAHHVTPCDLPGHVAARDDRGLGDDPAGYLVAHLQLVHVSTSPFGTPILGRGAGVTVPLGQTGPRLARRPTLAPLPGRWQR